MRALSHNDLLAISGAGAYFGDLSSVCMHIMTTNLSGATETKLNQRDKRARFACTSDELSEICHSPRRSQTTADICERLDY